MKTICYRLRENGTKDYGDLSAVDPPYQRLMWCDDCHTEWRGCWDNFQCPECGQGELPNSTIMETQPTAEERLTEICNLLVKLDWHFGYDLKSETDHEILAEACTLAREHIAKTTP